MSNDELETVMQRLDGAFIYGACDRVVSDIVNELMEGKRINRLVTIPAMLLEKAMVVADSETYHLRTIGSENEGDDDVFVRGEREIMRVMRQALNGENG